MTVGQRISQKRKELGLSQEGLGERLGVSRQAIYKWESDATLPEIEKLIALSRIFSVSVGWLLGEEDEPDRSRELTAEQLNMVEAIVDRYLAARAEAEKENASTRTEQQTEEEGRYAEAAFDQRKQSGETRKPRRWLWVLAALVLAAVFSNLFSRLDRVDSQYNSLQNAVASIDRTVNSQISSITGRVEEILKSQNQLTAQYGTALTAADLRRGTVTFTARAVPKTYVDGMTAVFVADSGDGPAEFPAELGPGREFWAELTCPLTDDIQLSVVFADGAQRETQLLDRYEYLYTNSFPDVMVNGRLWFEVDDKSGTLPAGHELAEHMVEDYTGKYSDQLPQAAAADIRVGLFQDRKLVQWYRTEMRSLSYNGEPAVMPFYVWDEVPLDKDAVYCEAAVVTDEFGRIRINSDTPIRWDESAMRWAHVDSWKSDLDPSDWEF